MVTKASTTQPNGVRKYPLSSLKVRMRNNLMVAAGALGRSFPPQGKGKRAEIQRSRSLRAADRLKPAASRPAARRGAFPGRGGIAMHAQGFGRQGKQVPATVFTRCLQAICRACAMARARSSITAQALRAGRGCRFPDTGGPRNPRPGPASPPVPLLRPAHRLAARRIGNRAGSSPRLPPLPPPRPDRDQPDGRARHAASRGGGTVISAKRATCRATRSATAAGESSRARRPKCSRSS